MSNGSDLPKILLAMDRPMSYSVGHTWHLFDQRLRYPTTRVSCRQLPRIDLDDFNVLILPAGNYSEPSQLNAEFAGRVKQWVREGGTLILVEGAAVWAAGEKIGLVDLKRVARPAKKTGGETDSAKPKESGNEDVAKRWPDSVPGAFLKAALFDPHWLTFGNPQTMDVFFHGNIFFEPLDPEKGRSVVQFSSQDDMLSSGFCWPETRETDCRENLPGSCVAGPRPCDCICRRSQLSCHVSQSAAPVYQRLSVRARVVGRLWVEDLRIDACIRYRRKDIATLAKLIA